MGTVFKDVIATLDKSHERLVCAEEQFSDDVLLSRKSNGTNEKIRKLLNSATILDYEGHQIIIIPNATRCDHTDEFFGSSAFVYYVKEGNIEQSKYNDLNIVNINNVMILEKFSFVDTSTVALYFKRLIPSTYLINIDNCNNKLLLEKFNITTNRFLFTGTHANTINIMNRLLVTCKTPNDITLERLEQYHNSDTYA